MKYFFRLDSPWLLLLLFIPLGLIFLPRWLRRKVVLNFPLATYLSSFVGWQDRLRALLPKAILFLSLFLCFLGFARPQWGTRSTEIETEGIDLVLVIDASGSMDALDFELGGKPVNRLTVVKKVVTDFIRNRLSDRIGMVVFGDLAYTQSPLTLDYDVLTQFVTKIKVGIAGEATAIGDGLALAVKRLKDSSSKSKVIVLLTDGKNNAGMIPPLKAAELAKALAIKVYTIGVATEGLVPIMQRSPFGDRLVRVKMDFDEESLKQIAQITGGEYFFATDTKKLQSIYATIDKMEKTEVKVKQYEVVTELFPFLVGASLLGLLLYGCIVAFWIKTVEP
ncbi:MAG: VWA domain-containing protein [Deltaproteobacteria bacterium]|nr:VWA domain-containing protein [Deltaproteobacteria bacterium]